MGNSKSISRDISILHRQYKTYVNSSLKPYGMNSSQFRIILLLMEEDGLSQSSINCSFYYDKGVMARMIKDLELEGYIYRKTSAKDKRMNLIYLTEKTKELKAIFIGILNEWTNKLASNLSKEEVEATSEILEKMLSNVME